MDKSTDNIAKPYKGSSVSYDRNWGNCSNDVSLKTDTNTRVLEPQYKSIMMIFVMQLAYTC